MVLSSPLALCDKGFGRGPPGGLGQYSSGAGSGGAFGAAADFGGAGVDAGALEDTIPGIPGEDYPIYASVPETSFSCDGQVDGGYYGDPEAECQAFHICANDGNSGLTKFSFLCPNGTLFQQQYFVCDWWFNVDCSTTEDFWSLNDEIAAERQASTPFQSFPPASACLSIENWELRIACLSKQFSSDLWELDWPLFYPYLGKFQIAVELDQLLWDASDLFIKTQMHQDELKCKTKQNENCSTTSISFKTE